MRRARGRLRCRRQVPVDRVRDEALGRYLIRRREEAVDWLDERTSVPPDLRNSDGDVCSSPPTISGSSQPGVTHSTSPVPADER